MNHDEYKRNCLKTESVISEDWPVFSDAIAVLEVVAAVGALVDLYKRAVFYKKPVSEDAKQKAILDISQAVNLLQLIRLEQNHQSTLKTDESRILHVVFGLITESAEMAETVYKAIREDSLNSEDVKTNLTEELGDGQWYTSIGLDVLGLGIEQIYDSNQAKLAKRYPKGFFDSDDAYNRDTDAEMKALTSTLGEQG